MRNCIVTENSATERGGGVYLDGGGLVESSYLHRNTSPGAAGSSEGYGGAAALSGGGDIRYSMIVNNFAANGGGLALYNPTGSTGTLADYLNMSAVSTIIANNTASNEAGGVYLHNGGILNNLTVVANRCNGTGITINDVQNGKSAGVYVKNYGCIINSVFWGGTVGTTGFVQYYHRPDADKTSAITSLVFYSAFPTKPSPSGPIPTGRRCCRSSEKIPLPFPRPTITLFSPTRRSMPMGGWRGRVCFPRPTIIRETMIMQPATIGNRLPFLP